MEPTDAMVFVVICDSRVEDNAVFGAEDLDFGGGVSCRRRVSKWFNHTKKETAVVLCFFPARCITHQ